MRRLLLLLPIVAAAQNMPADPPVRGGILRFDPGLVQVDAVVSGRDGRQVSGLTADDFEVHQDGKRRKIINVASVGGKDRLKQIPQVAVVVDDIALSLDAYTAVRGALARFIDEGNASVALISTSHGSGARRRFTSDRGVLRRALDDICWRPAAGLNIAFPEMSLLRDLDRIAVELGAIPGKKSLVLIAPRANTQMADVRAIADLANRASVTIYGVDANRRPRPAREQDTLSLLASATGGQFRSDCSSVFELLRAAAEDSTDYYLIGWEPGPDAFRIDPKRELPYRRIQIRARDRSLRVRTREGYFARTGVGDSARKPTGPDPLREALDSPFGGDFEVRLTSSFERQEAAGSYVASQVHVAPGSVKLSQDEGGCWNARVEVVRALRAVDPGMPLNDRVNTQSAGIHACGREAEQLLEGGFVAAVEDRVPTPGAYQVRVAVRDAAAPGAIGAATQFLAIPDLKSAGLALSGIRLWSGDEPPPVTADVSWHAAPRGDPGVRCFAAGSEVHYSFRVLGAVPAAVDVRLRVLREGQEVASVQTAPPSGLLPIAGLSPGVYAVGAIASGTAGKRELHAEQWIGFEIR
jgi:VWFA-related protein